MKKLIFATSNLHKVQEVREILQDAYLVHSLEDIGCTEEIPETAETFEGNALLKAQYVRAHFQVDCFAEDTGLEVRALNGAPGVYSARYAGAHKDMEANIRLLLDNLAGQVDRSAQFRTAIALIIQDQTYIFEGIVTGHIAESPSGQHGFGYDPVFIPDGYSTSFAEMTSSAKHAISHRGKAVAKLLQFLKSNPIDR